MAYKKLKYWFDSSLVGLLAEKLSKADPSFHIKQFSERVIPKLEPLELKARVEVIADALVHGYAGDYCECMTQLVKILGPENPKETGMFTEYYWIMPIAKVVEKYGLAHVPESMRAIEEITKRNTGEYAIHPFIERHFDVTMEQMQQMVLQFKQSCPTTIQ